MQSIRTLYKVGKGPSSSHTMGPERAAKLFREMTPEADRYEVILYGSLAKTGVGHGTDRVLVDTLAPYPTKIVFASVDPGNMKHPITLDLIAYQDNKETQRIRVESIGGGDIVVEGEAQHADAEVYPENSFAEIARFCQWRHVSLPEYVELNEGPEIWSFLEHIWHVMRQSIEDGLAAEGILPGGLNVQRKAKYLYERTHLLDLPQVRELQLVCSYAFAVAEQIAGNGTIGTALLAEDGTKTQEYDREAIYKAVKSYVDDYNSLLDRADDSKTKSILRAANSLKSNARANEKTLEKAGITVDADGRLSVDEKSFGKADMDKLKSLFTTHGSYATQTNVDLLKIASNAKSEAAKANTYSKNGMYTYNYSTGDLYNSGI